MHLNPQESGKRGREDKLHQSFFNQPDRGMDLRRWTGLLVLAGTVWEITAFAMEAPEQAEDEIWRPQEERESAVEGNSPKGNMIDPRQVRGQHVLQCFKNQAAYLSVRRKILAMAGDFVELRCVFSTPKMNIFPTSASWKRGKDTIATSAPHRGPAYPGGDRRLNFSTSDVIGLQDASLVISGVVTEDSGKYSCIWTTYPFGMCSSKIHLIVSDPMSPW
ncbi:nectin-1-like [Narcine bancroftii]|uniref:nectin-1-like n=1 Tax=Narcine bancroftii TaxID=1343680 RepID=UPI003831B150